MFAWMDGFMDGWINHNPSKNKILIKKNVIAGKKVFCLQHHLCTTGVSTPVVVHVWCCKQKKKSPPSPLKGAPLGVLRSRWPPPGGPPLVSGPHLCFSPPLLFCLIAGAAREKIFWVYFLGFRGLVAKASATMLASREGLF